ncbi:beta-1,4-mannosyl-glycoprotein 4-beta-N-acetylglucosaminyltransferase-like [Haemaphysalis longicornis]
MIRRLLTRLLLVALMTIVPGVILHFRHQFKPEVLRIFSESENRSLNAEGGKNNSATYFSSPSAHSEDDAPKGPATSPNCFPEETLHRHDARVCVCRSGWNDVDCAVPDAVWFSRDFREWKSQGLIKRRVTPRKIVNGLVLNHELDLLEIRVNELRDSVDYYVIVEANYTFFGTRKPLHLKSNMSAGFLSEHAHKIKPVAITSRNYEYGSPWAIPNCLRASIWSEGRPQLEDLQDDDLFWISDADEIPSRDVLFFLKHHDGYGEPIAMNLRWFLYGFFWENEKPVRVAGVCTIYFLRYRCGDSSLCLRNLDARFYRELPSSAGTRHQQWTITGRPPRYSGWHCSWCFDAYGMQVKLLSAQRDDGVRWGDIAEKKDLAYLQSLRKAGRYLDNSPPLRRCDAHEGAPTYVRNNADRYRYLMTP